MMGEFSGKSSNYQTGETHLLVSSWKSNRKKRQCRLSQVLQDKSRLIGLRVIKNRGGGKTILEQETKGQKLNITGDPCLGKVSIENTCYLKVFPSNNRTADFSKLLLFRKRNIKAQKV